MKNDGARDWRLRGKTVALPGRESLVYRRRSAKALKVKDSALAMAVGWLAREDKLDFEVEGKTVRLALKSTE